jgi:hypothetical protein
MSKALMLKDIDIWMKSHVTPSDFFKLKNLLNCELLDNLIEIYIVWMGTTILHNIIDQPGAVLRSKIGTWRIPFYLRLSILVLAAAGVGVPQGAIAISLDIPAALALLHRVGDGTLGVPARLDFCASLRPSSQIAQRPTINTLWYFALLQSRFGETHAAPSAPVIYRNKRSSLATVRRDGMPLRDRSSSRYWKGGLRGEPRARVTDRTTSIVIVGVCWGDSLIARRTVGWIVNLAGRN